MEYVQVGSPDIDKKTEYSFFWFWDHDALLFMEDQSHESKIIILEVYRGLDHEIYVFKDKLRGKVYIFDTGIYSQIYHNS